ncbi:5-oxoprolinase subunit B family protein [Paraburkholderia sp.]|uniref:5-oxoprolinase subunit B family protein n=1 Tax=Paraburkholderia sp. TaxID=1926495 RepID=UPI0039E380E5
MSSPDLLSAPQPAPLTIAAFGEAALTMEAPGDIDLRTQQRIWALAMQAERWDGVLETGLGMANLLVIFDPDRREPDELSNALQAAWRSLEPLALAGRVWEFPVVYGGERGRDLAIVAAHAGVGLEDAARLHAARDYVIFAPSVTPGFGYLYGVDPALVLPRKKTPIMLKEPGTISIGGVQATIGMTPGPSGWYALGYTTRFHHPFDPFRDPPLEVAVGDRIRFVIEDVLPC